MNRHLLLRFEAPFQAWGDVAVDPHRPTRSFPSLSGITGLLSSALGWRYRDGARTNALQDALLYAVREDRTPRVVDDFQTANLATKTIGWTRWGVEQRKGSVPTGTQLLRKTYLADGSFLVAIRLSEAAPVGLDELASALARPARPLFLGRKSCPPSRPILEGDVMTSSSFEALRRWPFPDGRPALRAWWPPEEGPAGFETHTVWDRRDFVQDVFAGARVLVEGRVNPAS